MKCLAVAAALFANFGAPAIANPAGEWRIADGTANVAIRPCGANYCGYVSWAKDADMVGRPVLISMKPSGKTWAGSILNARDGQKYTGRMSLRGEELLQVEGCVLGGMICGGQQWSRVR
ncbi:DUF2147 domain-containing protein [Methylocella tundrae]|uniref:DUF2147 domain-containing protein n=1 Tax=Methylocella tundrae TaxID=227605 RepID=A0A4U8Z3M8_METTU|nr:DUF2147 domain-containing protein [Methylocella tundrae]WPP03845.1 DUF2147 domain-containing protein [Methylocella tundrae]VFU10030.1 conserved exported protein of unknown function [Methylocella tundrae]